MAFYYVKNGGTATGDDGRYASQQTGSFAALGVAGYYDNIVNAIAATTSPVSGDFINPSDLHSFTGGASQNYTGVIPTPFYIMSVDDANIENSRTSSNRGSEIVLGGDDFGISNCFISGMNFTSSDNILFPGTTGSTLQDCELTITGSGDLIGVNGDGQNVMFTNCQLNLNNADSQLTVSGGGIFKVVGGSVVGGSTGNVLFSSGFANGGGNVRFKGVDLSTIDGTLIANTGGSEVSDDGIDVIFDMCKLSSGVAFTNEAFKSKDHRALFTRCSDSSAAAEYQYHLHAFGGDIDDDSAIFRNEDEAFTESNQKISYKIVTNSDASLGSPLWFNFPVLRYSRLSAGATDTLRFYITSNTTLTDKDIYIEISYPDGTNKQTPNFLTSAPATVGGTIDLMATGTTLTTDGSSTWTGALSNLYQIDVDTSGDVGADCQPIVKVYVTLPSVTIQIASEYGLS